jgi:adenosylmethionine-8-amino-7-oxononanoate aminotransferase
VAEQQREAAASPGDRGSRDTALWHGQAHMPSVRRAETIIARGEGAYVWTDAGQKLLDVPASLWYCNVGHGRREIADAVAEQLATIAAYSTFQEYATRPAVTLAARLAEMAPIPNAKVFLGSGGSDAVDTAAKLVRRYWEAVGQRTKKIIVTRANGYHGLHGFGTSLTGIEANRQGYGPHVPDTLRVQATEAGALRELIEREGAERVAAFFCEPVMGAGGVIYPPPGYLKEVRQICRENDVVFVVDEVITGFGRTGRMFASQRFELEPDVMLFAKGITSGYLPLGATVFSERLWEPFWSPDSDLVFRHGLTYSGHAAVCAAAHANLDILERERLVERVADLEPLLAAALGRFHDHELVREVRCGIGLLAGFELVDHGVAVRVVDACVEGGALMRLVGAATMQISPPFVITAEDIDFLAHTIDVALTRVAGEG